MTERQMLLTVIAALVSECGVRLDGVEVEPFIRDIMDEIGIDLSEEDMDAILFGLHTISGSGPN